jgi:nucleoside-diphosphate-sugar epimerase
MKYNILITGGAGYIGSKLSTELVNLKHNVTVLDNLMFSKNSLNHLFAHKNFKFIKGDVTDKKILSKHIKNKNFIIPLAALVGAPLCDKFKKRAIQVNLEAVKFILKLIQNNQKIIYPTTNSGYGIGEKGKYCNENSPLNPISLYGRTKADAEKEILKHKNSICFRLATVFGYSYRMRTDLLVNNLTFRAFKTHKLSIFQPNFRRNYIHINDIVRAFTFAIENFNKLKGNIFNLGLSSANLTKIQLAKKIKKSLPKTKIKIIKNMQDPDKRDYFVSNKKIERKGFKAIYSLENGIDELVNVFENSDLKIKNNY